MYKNRLRLAEVIVKNKMSRFFMVHCVDKKKIPEQNCSNTTIQCRVEDRPYNIEINNKIKLHILGVWQKCR